MTYMIKKEQIIGFLIIIVFIISVILTQTTQKKSSNINSLLFQKDGIAILDINGPISFMDYSSTLMPAGADLILNQLKHIQKDDHVKGLLLRINSPGGTVGASQEIYQAIKRIKNEKNIPIVAQIGDVGASGAYYVALGADHIFANPGSLVGSIGVILGNVNIEELAEKYGLDYNVYKSGTYKDILSMWRPSSEKEKVLLQALVDDVHSQFKNTFIKERNLSTKKGASLAQGQIYTGQQALELGIIDHLGAYHDAIAFIAKESGLGDDPHIITKLKISWLDVVNILNNQFKHPLNKGFNPGPVIQ